MTDTPKQVDALDELTEHMGRLRDELAALRSDHERLAVDLTGASGANGKVGTLRDRLDALTSRAWWLVTVLVGGIGAAAVKLVLVGRAYGELETHVHANAARIQLLENVTFLKSLAPDTAPKADTP